MNIKIRVTKTDQDGPGKTKAIIKVKDEKYCPCEAVKEWIKQVPIGGRVSF